MNGPWDRPAQRGLWLAAGLVLFGLSLALLVRADLGLDPWDVFTQGVARRTGLTMGQVTLVISLLVLACWIPLRQRPGVGTAANAVVVGPVLDLGLRLIPPAHGFLVQAAFLLAAIAGVALATGLYVGAGWGPGPRDGLMTGLGAHGVPISAARAGIELSVLVAGWMLGGQIGVGTVVFAVTIGPLVAFCLPRLQLGTHSIGSGSDGKSLRGTPSSCLMTDRRQT